MGISEILNNANEPVPRPIRRRVGGVAVVLIVFVLSWAVFKHAASADLSDAEVHSGLQDFAAGLQGDPDGFRQAERHFMDAASVSVFDHYPVFLVSTTRAVRDNRSMPGSEIVDSLRVHDFDEARARARDGQMPPKARDFWLRLIDQLEAVGAADKAP